SRIEVESHPSRCVCSRVCSPTDLDHVPSERGSRLKMNLPYKLFRLRITTIAPGGLPKEQMVDFSLPIHSNEKRGWFQHFRSSWRQIRKDRAPATKFAAKL